MTLLPMPSGFLLIISAPSGAGKSTVCKKLRQEDKSLSYSVSFTTRSPRRGERHGRHYFFVSEEEFRRRARRGEFLEWARVHGNCYGTPRAFIERRIKAGRVILLDIDVQGAHAIRRRRTDAVTVFLLPPSWKSLSQRLRRRQDEDGSIRRRLLNARKELGHAPRYDYWVVNDNLRTAVGQIEAIISAERLCARRHPAARLGLKRWMASR